MIELPHSGFMLVAPLFDAYPTMRSSVFAVIEGTQPGRIWVDDPCAPQAAIMSSDFVYLAGSPDLPGIRSALVDWLAQEALPNHEHVLTWAAPDAWHGVLPEWLAGFRPQRYVRATFRLNPDKHRASLEHPRQLPKGFTLQRLDEHTALEAGGLPELWGSLNQFLTKGFGFCVLDGNTFAGSTQTVFIGDGRAEVGIEVREPYRRRGLGTILGRAMIDHCLREGISPEWGCVQNPVSAALAESLGFEPGPDVPFWYMRGRAGS